MLSRSDAPWQSPHRGLRVCCDPRNAIQVGKALLAGSARRLKQLISSSQRAKGRSDCEAEAVSHRVSVFVLSGGA